MDSTTFAAVESTADPVEVVVRFSKTVKVERPQLKRTHPEDDENPALTKMKRKIEEQVLEGLNESYFFEPTMIVCRTNDQIIKALEEARESYELARAITKAGRYVSPPLSLQRPTSCF